MPAEESSERNALIVIGLVACATLVYEILLTRVCALRLAFHYSFLVIGNCLLGLGASGTLVFVFQERMKRDAGKWIFAFASLFLATLVPTYAFLVTFPVDPNVQIREGTHLLAFVLYNLGAAVPFFASGAVISLILTVHARDVHRFYAWDLFGAGAGCLACPFLLWGVGAGGCMAVVCILALAAVAIAAPERRRRAVRLSSLALGVVLLAFVRSLDDRFPVPSKEEIQVTADVQVDTREAVEYSQWSAISRVDLFPVPFDKREIFGTGTGAEGLRVPEEKFILQDGSAGTYVVDFSRDPEGLRILERSVYSAAVRVKENPRAFVIGVGGGNDVWALKHGGARSVKGVELNRQILDIHRNVLPEYSRDLLDDPTIELVHGEGRSALLREDAQYDVIQMSGIDTWTALTSGGYMLAENYLYTVEAAGEMLDRLAPGGVLAITRFSQETEALRLISNLHAAWESRGEERFAESIVCLISSPFATILARKGPFERAELEHLDRFAAEAGIEIAVHPERDLENVVARYVRAVDKRAFARDFPRDIRPVPDDRPYFFNFARWSDPLATAPYVDSPTPVTQGNPLFILGQLALSALASILLIVGPLLTRKGLDRSGAGRVLIYFGGVGFGFIAIEIALMQKLVLLLGHPLYSITVSLFAMLVFTGLGSALSRRRFAAPTRAILVIPVGLLVSLGTLVAFSPELVRTVAPLPTVARFLIAGAVVAPIGLLLGVPFAYGLRVLERRSPALVPWAWAINACATVIGSVLTVVLSINLGFSAVFAFAVGTYFVSAWVAGGWRD